MRGVYCIDSTKIEGSEFKNIFFFQGFRFFTVFTAAQSFYGGNLTLISLIDTKFSGENKDLHKWVMMTEDMSELRKTAFIEIT